MTESLRYWFRLGWLFVDRAIALYAPTNFWLWGVVMLIGVFTADLTRLIRNLTGRSEQPHPATKYHFMLHRFGELTIIVLGEFFIKLVTTAEDRELTTQHLCRLLFVRDIDQSLVVVFRPPGAFQPDQCRLSPGNLDLQPLSISGGDHSLWRLGHQGVRGGAR